MAQQKPSPGSKRSQKRKGKYVRRKRARGSGGTRVAKSLGRNSGMRAKIRNDLQQREVDK